MHDGTEACNRPDVPGNSQRDRYVCVTRHLTCKHEPLCKSSMRRIKDKLATWEV